MKSLISLYSRLSNRVIALLVLLIVIPVIGYGLYFVFGLNVGTLEIRISGGSPVFVAIKRWDVSAFERECDNLCRVEGIPAGTYSVVYSGSGIVETTENVTIRRWDRLELSFVPQGKISLEPIERVTQSGSALEIDSLVYAGSFQDKFYAIGTKPFALYETSGSGNTMKRYEAKGVIAYLTGSVQYGYFISITSDRTVHAVDLATLKTHDFTVPNNEAVRSVKPTGKQWMAVVESNRNSYLLDLETDKVNPLDLYDDLALSERWTLVGLIRATSERKRSLLNLEKRSGDLLVDTTMSATKRVLIDALPPVAHIHSVDGKFVVEYATGEWANINWID